jgi:hypothetical protein
MRREAGPQLLLFGEGESLLHHQLRDKSDDLEARGPQDVNFIKSHYDYKREFCLNMAHINVYLHYKLMYTLTPLLELCYLYVFTQKLH